MSVKSQPHQSKFPCMPASPGYSCHPVIPDGQGWRLEGQGLSSGGQGHSSEGLGLNLGVQEYSLEGLRLSLGGQGYSLEGHELK